MHQKLLLSNTNLCLSNDTETFILHNKVKEEVLNDNFTPSTTIIESQTRKGISSCYDGNKGHGFLGNCCQGDENTWGCSSQDHCNLSESSLGDEGYG